MKSRRSVLLCALCVLCVSVMAERPEFLTATDKLRAVFFANTFPKPPKETRAGLTQMLATLPTDSDLFALRAHEDERQLDFTAAEEDWKRSAQFAKDKSAAQIALADFYHRRNRGAEEVLALSLAATQEAYRRIQDVIAAQALPATLATTHYKAWIAKFPKESAVKRQFFEYLVAQKQFTEAEALLASYKDDEIFPVQGRASLALARGSAGGAAAVYNKAFQPLWPDELDRKSTRLNSSHIQKSRMPSSA